VKLLPWGDVWAAEKTGVIGISEENLGGNGWVKNDHRCEQRSAGTHFQCGPRWRRARYPAVYSGTSQPVEANA